MLVHDTACGDRADGEEDIVDRRYHRGIERVERLHVVSGSELVSWHVGKNCPAMQTSTNVS